MNNIENLKNAYNSRIYIDKYSIAIIKAAQWLEKLNPKELEGDDSSGWWLLLYIGKKIPYETSSQMFKKVENIIDRTDIGKSNFYTVSTMVRTLARSHNLSNKTKIVKRFADLLLGFQDKDADKYMTNIVWSLQTLYELNAFEDKEIYRKLKPIVAALKFDNFIIISMLWQILKKILEKRQLDDIITYVKKNKSSILNEIWLCKNTDWENSYLLLLFVDLNFQEESRLIADYLIDKQVDSQWDESLDENIEGTSLVGLALCVYWKYLNNRILNDKDLLIESLIQLFISNRILVNCNLEDEWILLSKTEINKGKCFEDFIFNYISSDSILQVEHRNIRTATEEIDFILLNSEKELFYEQLNSRQLLIECKNTKLKIAASEIRNFVIKIDNRKDLFCKIGVILSIAGFTKTALIEAKQYNGRGHKLVVPISGQDIEKAIKNSSQFSQLLQECIQRFSL